jgi:protein CpxP
MTMTIKLLRPLAFGASILILGAAGGTAFAQPAPPPAPMAGMRHDDGHRHQRPDPAARAQRHAEHLRAALQLTPAQEPALNTFVASMTRPDGMRDHRKGGREQMAAMSTPERLDHMKARMDEHRARFEQHAAATKRFYAQLSPSQQRAFDALQGQHMGHRGHGPMERGQRG